MANIELTALLDCLADLYGEPLAPPRRTLFELLLFENVAYLANDEVREQAFAELVSRVGTRPSDILAAPDEALSGAGILTELRPARLREIARLSIDEFGGDVESLRARSLREARRGLMRFPSIGEPGAEKILLFARSHAVLGLESNAVRVLTRLGLVQEGRTYAATYRGVQAFAAAYVDRGFDWLIRAHQLLRQHGQTLCRRTTPQCSRCPLSDSCAYFRSALPRATTA